MVKYAIPETKYSSLSTKILLNFKMKTIIVPSQLLKTFLSYANPIFHPFYFLHSWQNKIKLYKLQHEMLRLFLHLIIRRTFHIYFIVKFCIKLVYLNSNKCSVSAPCLIYKQQKNPQINVMRLHHIYYMFLKKINK